MSTKYIGEKITINAITAILQLIKSAHRHTSREIITALQSDYSTKMIRTTLYRLQRQHYIQGGAYQGYALNSKGLARLEKLHLHQLKQTGRWDRKWRLVFYDIPEQQRRSRNSMRKLIKKLGFKQLQQSVWAHPLPCLEEFEKIRQAYGIQKNVLLVEMAHTSDYEKLLVSFSKIYPNLTA